MGDMSGKIDNFHQGHFTSIIIISYNTFQYTKECIESIRRYTQPDSYEIIVVDNASRDKTPNWLMACPDIRSILNTENLGFPKGCNQGMSIARGSEILLLNSDTLVTEKWLSNMLTALYSSKKIGAVSCLTNNCSNWQKMGVSYNSWNELQSFARSFNNSNPAKWWKWMVLVGFCMLIKREVYEKIGGLDEIFTPGNYEDDDYSLRIRQAGYELLLCGDTFIHHHGRASFFSSMTSEERQKKEACYWDLLDKNRNVFFEKWGLEDGYNESVPEMMQLLGGTTLKGKVLVLDFKLYAILYILARSFPGTIITGVTSKEKGILLAHDSFNVIFCRNIETELFTRLTEKFDAVVYLEPVLSNNSGSHAFLQEVADKSLDFNGTLFYTDGKDLCRINKDSNRITERKMLVPMIIPIELVDFSHRVRNLSIGAGSDVVPVVTLGPGSYLVSGSLDFGSVDAHILVGRYSSLGHRLKFIVGYNHSSQLITTYPFRDLEKTYNDGAVNHYREVNHYQIIIGNDVWIGADVTILGGVKIGNGAVVGAGAVIAKDVPPYAVVAGNPARIVKYRFSEDVIARLQGIKWWNWSEERIKENRIVMEQPENFLKIFEPPQKTNAEADFADSLKPFKENGKRIYAFVADFGVNHPLWPKILEEYIKQFTERDDVVLLFASLDEEHGKDMEAVEEFLQGEGDSRPSVALFKGIGNVLGEFVKSADCFVTTREDVSSQCVDYASGYDIKILSGLDDNIFEEFKCK